MSALRQALADYLAVRRVLGYKLVRAEKLLGQFLAYVEDRGEDHLTTETALAWAILPAEAHRSWTSTGFPLFVALPLTCTGSTPRPRCRRWICCRDKTAGRRLTSTRRRK
jgi:hypothetical protein